MAGKKGKSGRKAENTTLSERVKQSILDAAAELAEEYGETIEKSMMRLCYIKETQASVKASIFKEYLGSTVVRETKSENKSDITTITGPGILLPEINGEEK